MRIVSFTLLMTLFAVAAKGHDLEYGLIAHYELNGDGANAVGVFSSRVRGQRGSYHRSVRSPWPGTGATATATMSGSGPAAYRRSRSRYRYGSEK